jgi:hypothetical protein
VYKRLWPEFEGEQGIEPLELARTTGNNMPTKQTRSGQSAVSFEMSTRNRSCRDLRTPQSAEEQADLTEHSEQFESENTPTDSTEESMLDPQWHKMPRQARLSFN